MKKRTLVFLAAAATAGALGYKYIKNKKAETADDIDFDDDDFFDDDDDDADADKVDELAEELKNEAEDEEV